MFLDEDGKEKGASSTVVALFTVRACRVRLLKLFRLHLKISLCFNLYIYYRCTSQSSTIGHRSGTEGE